MIAGNDTLQARNTSNHWERESLSSVILLFITDYNYDNGNVLLYLHLN